MTRKNEKDGDKKEISEREREVKTNRIVTNKKLLKIVYKANPKNLST
jgi:hypothetical protein